MNNTIKSALTPGLVLTKAALFTSTAAAEIHSMSKQLVVWKLVIPYCQSWHAALVPKRRSIPDRYESFCRSI